MDRNKIKLAVIGCGRIARQGHLPYLKNHPRARVAAAVDVSESNTKSVCREAGIPNAYDDAEKMFAAEKPDGVLICTPNWAHKPLTLMAAEHGAHVFCEKPMAVNAAECEDMIAACGKAGVNLQIGMVKRFDAGFVRARKMARDGRLGRVSQIYASYLNPPPPRLDGPVFKTAEKWAARLGVDLMASMGLWRMTDERTGGGQLLEMGTHLLDLFFYFLGEHPERHGGLLNRNRDDMRWEDQGTLIVKMPSGAICTAEMNMSVTADNMVGEKGTIYGSRASLAFNHVNAMWYGLPFHHYYPTRLSLYQAHSPVTGMGFPVWPIPAGRAHYMHKLQMDYFIDGILGRNRDYFGMGEDFAATGRDGLEAMRVISAAYEAREVSGAAGAP